MKKEEEYLLLSKSKFKYRKKNKKMEKSIEITGKTVRIIDGIILTKYAVSCKIKCRKRQKKRLMV
jgi:hypothetical protein